jgi:hypothetical protein
MVDSALAKNSADFFKALRRLLYLYVKPCPSSSPYTQQRKALNRGSVVRRTKELKAE